MIKSRKSKRFVWILFLALGPVAYCILLAISLLTPPGTANITVITDDLPGFLEGLASLWAGGFVIVWLVYWSGKFMVKYGPFM